MRTTAGLSALFALACSIITSSAQPAATAQIGTRALTPQEIKTYGLPATTQVSGGLSTVGLGQPVYLEAQVRLTIPASNILGVTWTLTSRPPTSTNTLQASPITPSMPIYNPGDRGFYQVAGTRQMLRPDVTGQYLRPVTIPLPSILKTQTSYAFRFCYIFPITASANSLHLTSFAPSIKRAKS